MRLIDFHTHLLPDPLLVSLRQEWELKVWPTHRGSNDQPQADLLAVMPVATGPGQAAELNRWIARVARTDPRMVPLASFHPSDELLPDLVEEALAELQLRGADLHCQAGQFYPDDRRLFPLYDRATALDKPVVFHVSRQPLPSRYVGVDPFYHLMRRVPRLKAVVAHLGADEMEAFLDLADTFKELYFDTSFVFCPQFNYRPTLERVLELQDRIVYASGSPMAPCDHQQGIAAIRRLALGPGIEDKIFYSNAARLLGLGEE